MQAASEIKMRHLTAVSDLSVMSVRVGVANFFLGLSIGIVGVANFFLGQSIDFLKFVGGLWALCATGLGGLWALDYAWHVLMRIYISVKIFILACQYISIAIFYLAYKLWAPQVWAACGRYKGQIRVTSLRCAQTYGTVTNLRCV